ncbi:PIR Superfamily Protein [Plasmodium ovale wallikeri]|uniref:PIR Superfamily Protein n=1 Tax=Plasmodium ovale wallikeri TaxID=864142 RepID=A0A1A9AJH6_PLAOA|nr:PIR Superfamily Protein [Plasmodium ovale wallikeri]
MGDGKTERGPPSLSAAYPIDLPTEKFYNDMKKEYPSLDKYTSLCDTNIRFDNVCEAYYKKIEGTKSLYKYFENKCSSDKYDCPYFYKNYMHYNPENVLTNLPCHQPIKSQKEDTLEYLTLTQHNENPK